MIKTIAIGIWVIAVALGAVFGATILFAPKDETAAAAKPEAGGQFTMQKTPAVSIPMISDGAVQGYVTAQFGYLVDPAALKELPIQPDVYLEDEAFRRIYSDNTIDFKHLEKLDLTKLTADLLQATNARLGSNIVKSIVIQDFNFVSKADVDR